MDCAATFTEAYLAVETGDASGPKEVFAVVCLLSYRPKDYFNFGYKDMSEDMGPYYYNCPERILKLLTPTENKLALEWREKCWERIRAKKARPKLREGMIIQFVEPLQFSNGVKENIFKLEDLRRLIVTDRWGFRYRIRRKSLEKPFKVLDDFPAAERKLA
ncbi:DUF6927 domain-containing protein [Neomoorella thermoacetica]|uniref:DUF6927 domain-containing protein n=1 Tax=Neomoorella thermoacetica TaxID=1525 RepID=UPI0018C89FB4|nr:hypothetical protein [Moorella thermoacetica]